MNQLIILSNKHQKVKTAFKISKAQDAVLKSNLTTPETCFSDLQRFNFSSRCNDAQVYSSTLWHHCWAWLNGSEIVDEIKWGCFRNNKLNELIVADYFADDELIV